MICLTRSARQERYSRRVEAKASEVARGLLTVLVADRDDEEEKMRRFGVSGQVLAAHREATKSIRDAMDLWYREECLR